MAPKNSHEAMVVKATPPRSHPMMASTQPTSLLESPPSAMTLAPKMKKGTAMSANLSMLPNICVAIMVMGVVM